MIRLTFVPPVGDPAWDKWISDVDAAVEAMLGDPSSEHDIDDALYRSPRDLLIKAAHFKCAYCEAPIPPTVGYGDVDHYRPKGRVKGRDGRIVRVIRNGVSINHPGYFWLAYDYRNLLPTCPACNRKSREPVTGEVAGKADYFPTQNDVWASGPDELDSEQPLLLNPWLESDDPSQHLHFDPTTGLVMGLTPRGVETIELLGLNLANRPVERLKAADAVIGAVTQAFNAVYHGGRSSSQLALLRAVADGSASYAAICRQAIRDRRAQEQELREIVDQV